MTATLTERQTDVAVVIRDYRHANGIAPTLQEVADVIGTSKITALEHVRALHDKGVIKWQKHMARSIEMVDDSALPPAEETTRIPLLGNISAGVPIEGVEQREELDLATLFARRGGTYVLRVVGDSMAGDHMCEGDYVILDRKAVAKSGKTVVATIYRTESTLCRWHRLSNDRVRLEWADKAREPRVLDADQVKVVGVVIGVLRSY